MKHLMNLFYYIILKEIQNLRQRIAGRRHTKCLKYNWKQNSKWRLRELPHQGHIKRPWHWFLSRLKKMMANIYLDQIKQEN